MGFRARKSFKVAPGVRLNVSKTGVGLSGGVKGARYSVHSSGRRTTSVGVPGTGVGWRSDSGGSRSRSAPASTGSANLPAQPPRPGLMASKGEKALHKALVASGPRMADLEVVAEEHPDQAPVARLFAGALRAAQGDLAAARTHLQRAFGSSEATGDLAEHPFVRKYLAGVSLEVPIATGVTAPLPIGTDTAGLLLAEVLQAQASLEAAIEVVERVEPTSYAAVSLAELYLAAGRYDDVVDLTNGITNDDASTALLCVLRGRALHELGHHDAALEALKQALRSKSRPAAIRHQALATRAETYLALGKRAQAIKDLERILGEDASDPSVRQRLEELKA